MSSVPAQVWSCGGGTQSAAIAVLILQGRLPKPDHSYIVDTTRERSSTWAYFDGVMRPAMLAAGLDIVRVNRDDYSDTDLLGGKDDESILMPMYTAPAGRLEAYCSGEWKRDVGMRYMRRALGLARAVQWIGISTDEMKRVRTPRRQWCQLRYPLIEDVPTTRDGCKEIVRAFGWPTPPRSSCWMCPHHSDDEWADIQANQPEDFDRAVVLESELREQDAGVYLHPRRIPLPQIDFTNRQGTFGGNECAEGCFT